MTVHARSEHARGAAAARRLARRAGEYLAALGVPGAELSLLVADDLAVRALNRRWRGQDRATDVLSFPAAGPGPLLGDVVISLDTARRAAREAGRTLSGELDRYLAHGILHLLGHDHARQADARRMARAEDALVGEGMVSAARARPAASAPPPARRAAPAEPGSGAGARPASRAPPSSPRAAVRGQGGGARSRPGARRGPGAAR